MDWSVQLYILGEVTLALVLSGLIGLERELAGRPAGFRTQMLVAGSAALLVGLGEVLLERFSAGGEGSLIRADPIRIVEAIITGISFLGAGTIFRRDGEQVEGLTTAATLLLSGALGICVALRQLVLAIGVTLLALVILRGFQRVEVWLTARVQRTKGP
jgi:putative Mg2+ transporter-C (MgtC) family protein